MVPTQLRLYKNGDEKYRMVLFSDGTDQSPFSRMKTCVEKGFLDKGKPIWVEAEMSYYQKKMISDEAWEKFLLLSRIRY